MIASKGEDCYFMKKCRFGGWLDVYVDGCFWLDFCFCLCWVESLQQQEHSDEEYSFGPAPLLVMQPGDAVLKEVSFAVI